MGDSTQTKPKITIEKTINNVNDDASYYELFNNDIWITIIVIIIVFLVTSYYLIISSIRSYKANWAQNKCNPLMMPFASIINPELANGNEFGYTADNFTECLNALNAELATDMTKPINEIRNNLSDFFSTIYDVAETTRGYVVMLFNLIVSFFSLFIDKITNFVLHTQLTFITINDFFAKLLSVFTVILYTLQLLISAYRTIFILAVMGFMLVFIAPVGVILLTQLTIVIGCVIQIAIYGWGLPWTLPVFISMIVLIITATFAFIFALILFIILMIIYIVLLSFLREIG